MSTRPYIIVDYWSKRVEERVAHLDYLRSQPSAGVCWLSAMRESFGLGTRPMVLDMGALWGQNAAYLQNRQNMSVDSVEYWRLVPNPNPFIWVGDVRHLGHVYEFWAHLHPMGSPRTKWLQPGCYDLVVMSHLLEFLTHVEQQQVWRGVFRVLSNDGLVLVENTRGLNLPGGGYTKQPHMELVCAEYALPSPAGIGAAAVYRRRKR